SSWTYVKSPSTNRFTHQYKDSMPPAARPQAADSHTMSRTRHCTPLRCALDRRSPANTTRAVASRSASFLVCRAVLIAVFQPTKGKTGGNRGNGVQLRRNSCDNRMLMRNEVIERQLTGK